MAAISDGLAVWQPGDLKPTAYPVPGMYLDGTGDYASTPDDNSLDITSDIDIRVAVLLTDWTPSSNVALLDKATANNESYLFYVETTGKLVLRTTTGGTSATAVTGTSPTNPSLADGTPMLLRVTLDVDNGSGQRVYKFYFRPFFATTYMADLADDTNAVGAWVQIGGNVTTAGTTSIFSGTGTVTVGHSNVATSPPSDLNGAVYGVVIKNGIGGTTVANPDFGIQSDATAAFADGAGRTWSMNGDAYMVPPMDGWLLADGSSLDTTTYADLFTTIRYRWGGSGTSFTLPDFMKANRFMRGGFIPGTTGGAASHTFGGNQLTTQTGATNRYNSIDGTFSTSQVVDNQPPYGDVTVWIKY